MSGVRYGSVWPGALLLLALAGSAEAQYPRSSGRTTSTVGTYFGDTTAAAPAPAPATGALRQLVCRGAEGLQLATVANPSPRSDRQVEVSLSYRRNPRPAGTAYEQLEPGACSWNTVGDASLPAEPGIVHFDLDPQGSEYVPDPTTLTQWLNNPRHYWSFYVNDLTNVSISYGAYGATFRAPAPGETQTASRTGAKRNERLRCRGGGRATFAQGQRKGPNLFAMTLKYQVASTAAGPIGKGLQPGTCAWADRTDAIAEPGRIEFTTARNAQREQEQTGGVVDSSATAAERWPDLRTIPAYMTDPAHYWTFNVSLTNPDSALRHGAWVPTAPAAPAPQSPGPVATTPAADDPYTSSGPAGQRTGVSLPGGSTTGDRYTPGGTSTATDPRAVFDIRNVQVRTGLEGVTIIFEAAPSLAPVVTVSTMAPEGADGSRQFSGASARLVVQGTPTGGTHWRYSAATSTPLARGTGYWFIADAPEGPNSRHNQATGEFRTLAQRVTITINEIYVVSDGDSDSDGDLWFYTESCPQGFFEEIAGGFMSGVQWSEGRHAVNRDIVSSDASDPDRFRLLIVGVDDDEDRVETGGSRKPNVVCETGGNLEPGSTPRAEWNAVLMDLDLSRYPGAKGGEPFVRRSQPLRNGSTLMFEVRGHVTVTRE
ncbi:MAG TPA: hypothetical protein VM387_06375 [Gemmatimonadales bacterium]|nr:hypothetical protein [Gemmatimonadales bacterium]